MFLYNSSSFDANSSLHWLQNWEMHSLWCPTDLVHLWCFLPSIFCPLIVWSDSCRHLQILVMWEFAWCLLNPLRPRQNNSLFADNIFRFIFFNENFVFFLNFHWYVPKGPIDKKASFGWDNGVTQLLLDKMALISQTIFSNAFLWMKSFVFWLKYHWSLFVGVQLTQCWFG